MTRIYILIVLTLLRVGSYAQVDMGMENWVPGPLISQDPQGWTSFNVAIFSGMSQTVFEENFSPYSGQASAKIVTASVPAAISVPNPHQGNQRYDTVGLLAMGKINANLTNIIAGQPLPVNRPMYLFFASKYSPVGNDSAFVLVYLTKYSSGHRDTIATGKYATGNSSSSYAMNGISLNYNSSTVVPDSQFVFVHSSIYSHNGARIGSTFYVDDFNWSSASFLTTVNDVNCYGGSTGSIIVNNFAGTTPFQYSKDGGVTYQASNVFSGLPAGNYSIVVKDANNTISNPSIVSVQQEFPILLYSNVTTADCGQNNGAIYAYASGGGFSYSYLWSNGVTGDFNPNLPPGAYTYTVTDSYGCSVTSSVITVGTYSVGDVLPLCIVTVDSLSTHNIVVWEKSGLPATIDSFRIYREVMTNVYKAIGSVSNDSISVYHDHSSNPNVTSYKYKLGLMNTCGDTTGNLSFYHNTIHLQYLGFGNFSWSLYEIEGSPNSVNFFIVNRDNNGTGIFLPISSSIPGSNTSYTDINYAGFPNAQYRIDVNWNISCNATQKSFLTTRSNIISVNPISVAELENDNSILISPNPVTSQMTIAFDKECKNTTVKILDLVGKEVRSINFSGKQLTLDKGEMQSGIYFVQIVKENSRVVNKKVIIQ